VFARVHNSEIFLQASKIILKKLAGQIGDNIGKQT
jgi:hypothetical protein